MNSVSLASPRTGSSAAPVNIALAIRNDARPSVLVGQLSSSSLNHRASSSSGQASPSLNHNNPRPPSSPRLVAAGMNRRRRSHSGGANEMSSPRSPASLTRSSSRKSQSDAFTALAKARSRDAQKANDAMVYLDGPQVYTCAQCRTHLTSHDEIISKSFHGRHGVFANFEYVHELLTSMR